MVKEPGYVYIYPSNKETTPVDVFFDDFKVEHIKSPVIQIDDYYPFGLTFNSYQEQNGNTNHFLYNGKEVQDELGMGWMDYGARMYMADIGRFFTQDRFAEKYYSLAPYQYTSGSPVNFNDVNGDYIVVFGTDEAGNSYSVLYENGKAYNYTKDSKGNIVKGSQYDGKNKFIENAVSDLNSIAKTRKGGKRIDDLRDSKNEYGIREASALKQSRFSGNEGGGGTIYYSQGGGFLDGVSYSNSSFALGHEIQHAWDLDQSGTRDFLRTYKGHKQSEKNAVEFENYLRAMAGETNMRMTYSGTKFFKDSSPEYFKNLEDPLRSTEGYWIPPTPRYPGQDATYYVPNYRPIRIDTRTGKFVNPNE